MLHSFMRQQKDVVISNINIRTQQLAVFIFICMQMDGNRSAEHNIDVRSIYNKHLLGSVVCSQEIF